MGMLLCAKHLRCLSYKPPGSCLANLTSLCRLLVLGLGSIADCQTPSPASEAYPYPTHLPLSAHDFHGTAPLCHCRCWPGVLPIAGSPQEAAACRLWGPSGRSLHQAGSS